MDENIAGRSWFIREYLTGYLACEAIAATMVAGKGESQT